MNWLHLVGYFFGGAFLSNAIPHFVSGTMGRPFQSPFANPRGEGLSSSTVNIVWGFANLVFAYVLLVGRGSFDLHVPGDAAAAGLGLLAMGLIAARLFGRFHGGNSPTAPTSITATKGS
ncbi:hypothetical protein [Paraburkholderia sp.]|uniref:hypothetical protein n=1 Tax=Paraburkholderia sp. TaxID=1926495 RepID=UPI003D6F26D9